MHKCTPYPKKEPVAEAGFGPQAAAPRRGANARVWLNVQSRFLPRKTALARAEARESRAPCVTVALASIAQEMPRKNWQKLCKICACTDEQSV